MRPVRIILMRPRNPLNIGAAARAMANFGHRDLIVVDPYEAVWQETRSAPEAEDVILKARKGASWEEATQDCAIILGTSSFHQRPVEQAVIELPNLGRYLSSFPSSAPLALIFGSERSGLSNDDLSRCQAILHIPTQSATPSMNLAQAVAVTLYELRRSAWEAPGPATPAPAEEFETLITTLADVGEAMDYPAGYTASARLGRIRQALHPAVFPAATVRFLLSFFRKVHSRTDRRGGYSKLI